MAEAFTEETLEQIFGPEGLLKSRLSHYEYRPSQLAMAKAVLRAIQERRHLCVEAGTGTGKTLAYLIPALSSRKRVVVSTATKNLQEQLFFKDIPFIRRHLFPGLAATYMKGRQNYLCLKRLYGFSSQGHLLEEMEGERSRLGEWAETTETGDRSELDWLADDDPLWRQLDARSETCLGQKCDYFDRCFVTRMRQRALESDVVIVNHALLMAHLALEQDEIGRILPEFAVLILDEAHELEGAASSHFGCRVSNYQVEELCRDWAALSPSPEEARNLQKVLEHSQRLFAGLPGEEGRRSLNLHPRPGGSVVDLRLELEEPYRSLRSALLTLYHGALAREGGAEREPLLRRLQLLLSHLEQIFDLQALDRIFWFEKRGRGVFLHATPMQVDTILRELVFSRTDSVILTSATLAIHQSFQYIKGRLGVPEAEEMIAPGEFDYSRQAILYVPRSFPEPGAPHYSLRLLQEIQKILEITQGHAFLLFTSHAHMERIYRALLNRIQFPLLKQGMGPKRALLEEFCTTPHAVLCATSSFWQGVDVQGDALRAVIIDKLPFQVPTEPVTAARLRHLSRQGLDPFRAYTLPEAVISLKQGVGRLIRSRQDRGILAIFDSRLHSRSYGPAFLQSLPNCPVTDNIEALRNFFLEKGSL